MKLIGMLAISKHMGLSESTVMELKRDKDFPMKNVDSVWEITIEEIKKWRGEESEPAPKSEIKPVKKTTKKK